MVGFEWYLSDEELSRSGCIALKGSKKTRLEISYFGVVWLCISWYWVLMAGQAVSISRGINGSWALYFSWGDDFNLTRALLFRFAHAVSHKVWYFQIMVVFVLV